MEVDFGSQPVETVVVEVTAADISTPLAVNLQVAAGTAVGTITVPAGSGRTFTVRCYDVGGIETHRGSTIVDVTEGSNPTISLTLLPLTGDQPIEARTARICGRTRSAREVTRGG